MTKKPSKLQSAQQKAEAAAKITNERINELGRYTDRIYDSLSRIQEIFDCIRGMPEENRLKYEQLKAVRVNWKQQVEKIEVNNQKSLFLCITISYFSHLAAGIIYFKTKSDKERLENIYTLISNRDIKSYELASVELSERTARIVDENQKLRKAIEKIMTFGTDYSKMTEAQQYELGAYVNLMEASTMLLVNPILGLQPKFSEEDFDRVCAMEPNTYFYKSHKNMIIYMANLLYKIQLDEKDKKILIKSLRKNREFLESVQMTKDEFDVDVLAFVEQALDHRYKFKAY